MRWSHRSVFYNPDRATVLRVGCQQQSMVRMGDRSQKYAYIGNVWRRKARSTHIGNRHHTSHTRTLNTLLLRCALATHTHGENL